MVMEFRTIWIMMMMGMAFQMIKIMMMMVMAYQMQMKVRVDLVRSMGTRMVASD